MNPILIFLSCTLANDRPWYFDVISSRMVESIVALRHDQVPTSAASSMAHLIVDGMMSPPQATEFAHDMVSSYVGRELQPRDILNIAQEAAHLYGQVRTEASFDSYLNYVSAHAHNFDLRDAIPSATRGGSPDAAHEQFSQLYHSLDSDPNGHLAINIGRALATSIAHDAKVPVPSWVTAVP